MTQRKEPTKSGRNDPDDYDLEHPLAREYIAARDGTTLGENAVKSRMSYIRNYNRFLKSEGTTLLEAETDHVQRFIESLVRSGRAKSTVSHYFTGIKELYKYITIETDEEPNFDFYYIDEMRKTKYNYKGGFERKAIKPDEVKLLFENFTLERDRIAAYLAVATGMRHSEILDLKIDDIDFSERNIFVGDPKGGPKRAYHVPMSNILSRKLKQWIQVGRKSYPHYESHDYVFPSPRGGRIGSRNTLARAVRNAAEAAGIQSVIATTPDVLDCHGNRDDLHWHRVTPHTLKHTFVTMLSEQGVPPESRRLLANHKNIDTTRGYEHVEEYDPDLIRDMLLY